MSGRRLTTTVTMTALALLLCGMAWWGYAQATKPLPTLGDDSSGTPRCSDDEISEQRFVERGQVTVSVYNAGARQGFAGLTLQRLEERGFNAGSVGNAPEGIKVRRVAVYTTKADDPAAELVARNLGKNVRIEVTAEEMGPGVDVVVGKKMGGLPGRAPARIKLAEPIITCIPVD